MFVDEVKVTLEAGNGGAGCMSFRRERFRPKGGPDGGNGGRGGDIVLLADGNVADLTSFLYQPYARAQNGEPGRGNDQHGAAGSSRTLHLPVGTRVIDPESGEILVDLQHHQQSTILLQGGQGGLGNASFKTPENQAPRNYTEGEPGETGEFNLVLQIIADIGLVGVPNAGKSSLLRALTRARPKVGAYPFTTLQPSVGVIEYPDFHRITMADIPGLIDGAHQNRGLGHRFLRHIERCPVLLYVLDGAAVDGTSALESWQTLQQELACYTPSPLDKPSAVVLNKIDLPEAAEGLKELTTAHPELSVFPISCLTGEGLDSLREHLRQLLPDQRA